MDNNGNSNGQTDGERLRPSLEELLFIPFYDAITSGDLSKVGLEKDTFDDLVVDFFRLSGSDKSSLEEQLDEKKYDIAILSGALQVLITGYDEDMAEIVRGFGIRITEETHVDSLELIGMAINRLHKDFNILKTQLPPKPKNLESMTSYDILANLSSNLEFGVNFKEFTVGEYISYTKVVKRKSDSIKKQRNGRAIGKN